MNAAGFSPFRLFRPFLYATAWWRSWSPSSPPISRPTACAASSNGTPRSPPTCSTNILQPGRFAQLDQNLTIRIRERQPGGLLGRHLRR